MAFLRPCRRFLDFRLHFCLDVYADLTAETKGAAMPKMDYFHGAILEGYWQGLEPCEIAHQLGADVIIVARIVDDFKALGF